MTESDRKIHLLTGIIVCREHKTWCGAKADSDARGVPNVTELEERCSCDACLSALEAVRARVNAKLGKA